MERTPEYSRRELQNARELLDQQQKKRRVSTNDISSLEHIITLADALSIQAGELLELRGKYAISTGQKEEGLRLLKEALVMGRDTILLRATIVDLLFDLKKEEELFVFAEESLQKGKHPHFLTPIIRKGIRENTLSTRQVITLVKECIPASKLLLKTALPYLFQRGDFLNGLHLLCMDLCRKDSKHNRDHHETILFVLEPWASDRAFRNFALDFLREHPHLPYASYVCKILFGIGPADAVMLAHNDTSASISHETELQWEDTKSRAKIEWLDIQYRFEEEDDYAEFALHLSMLFKRVDALMEDDIIGLFPGNRIAKGYFRKLEDQHLYPTACLALIDSCLEGDERLFYTRSLLRIYRKYYSQEEKVEIAKGLYTTAVRHPHLVPSYASLRYSLKDGSGIESLPELQIPVPQPQRPESVSNVIPSKLLRSLNLQLESAPNQEELLDIMEQVLREYKTTKNYEASIEIVASAIAKNVSTQHMDECISMYIRTTDEEPAAPRLLILALQRENRQSELMIVGNIIKGPEIKALVRDRYFTCLPQDVRQSDLRLLIHAEGLSRKAVERIFTVIYAKEDEQAVEFIFECLKVVQEKTGDTLLLPMVQKWIVGRVTKQNVQEILQQYVAYTRAIPDALQQLLDHAPMSKKDFFEKHLQSVLLLERNSAEVAPVDETTIEKVQAVAEPAKSSGLMIHEARVALNDAITHKDILKVMERLLVEHKETIVYRDIVGVVAQNIASSMPEDMMQESFAMFMRLAGTDAFAVQLLISSLQKERRHKELAVLHETLRLSEKPLLLKERYELTHPVQKPQIDVYELIQQTNHTQSDLQMIEHHLATLSPEKAVEIFSACLKAYTQNPQQMYFLEIMEKWLLNGASKGVLEKAMKEFLSHTGTMPGVRERLKSKVSASKVALFEELLSKLDASEQPAVLAKEVSLEERVTQLQNSMDGNPENEKLLLDISASYACNSVLKAKIFFHLSVWCQNKKRLTDAKQYVQKALELSPQSRRSYEHLAELFAEEQNWGQAFHNSLQSLKVNLTYMHRTRSQLANAAEEFREETIGYLQSIFPKTYTALDKMHALMSRFKQSKPQLLQWDAVEKQIGQHVGILADAWCSVGQHDKAIALLEEYSRHMLWAPQLEQYLGELYVEQKEPEKAIALYRRRLKSGEEETRFLVLLAETYENLGDTQQSLYFAERLHALRPLDVTAGRIIAGNLLTRGKNVEAFRILRPLLKKHPKNEAIRALVEQAEQMKGS